MLRFMVVNPKGQSREVECTLDTCSVGKGDENLIVLQGWSVARKHASFVRRTDGVYVEDHGSMAGTRVDGQKIGVFGPLTTEMEVSVGDYTLRVFDEPGSVVAETQQETPSVVCQVQPDSPEVASDIDPGARQSEEITRMLKHIHGQLILQMDLRRTDVTRKSEEELREATRVLLEEIVAHERLPDGLDAPSAVKRVLDEVVGLGPLEDLLDDEKVSEIMVNAHDEIFIERGGKLQLSPVCFTGPQSVLAAIERIVSPLGRRIDESSPLVDARLKDGSRVNAVIPPLALKGPCITIRKFSKNKLNGEDLVRFGSMTPAMLEFLVTVVKQKSNILISGGTGSGKTTLLNVLSNYIPDDERVVTVEDAAELKLTQPNLVSLEARPPNAEGKGQVSIRDLVRNCLRMRPDRIVVGECRGAEALDMLTAMNTGHDGSLTTLHANTPRDCLSRVEVMVMMAGMDLPMRAIREQIASAIRFIVQQTRFSCGTRKITHVTEVTGMEGEIVQMQDIFLYKQDGFGPDGKVRGKHVATGQIPEFCEELAARGIQVDLGIFDPKRGT